MFYFSRRAVTSLKDKLTKFGQLALLIGREREVRKKAGGLTRSCNWTKCHLLSCGCSVLILGSDASSATFYHGLQT